MYANTNENPEKNTSRPTAAGGTEQDEGVGHAKGGTLGQDKGVGHAKGGSGSKPGMSGKIKGAYHVVHGIGDNIRGTALGAIDTVGHHADTKNDELAQKGRLETEQGLATFRGVGSVAGAGTQGRPPVSHGGDVSGAAGGAGQEGGTQSVPPTSAAPGARQGAVGVETAAASQPHRAGQELESDKNAYPEGQASQPSELGGGGMGATHPQRVGGPQDSKQAFKASPEDRGGSLQQDQGPGQFDAGKQPSAAPSTGPHIGGHTIGERTQGQDSGTPVQQGTSAVTGSSAYPGESAQGARQSTSDQHGLPSYDKEGPETGGRLGGENLSGQGGGISTPEKSRENVHDEPSANARGSGPRRQEGFTEEHGAHPLTSSEGNLGQSGRSEHELGSQQSTLNTNRPVAGGGIETPKGSQVNVDRGSGNAKEFGSQGKLGDQKPLQSE
ncbi:hypothetical protein Hypma_004373 [Hypsizygus marmoreus]|uniref:Uncharacterized protein n=1 Tax=Hypsizygus marmoreus TaxID=39966 RepID=A0A369JZW5_HYPMA|nr:hypothetical protein Hypma_004373 [Hypsizygus marmoreus]